MDVIKHLIGAALVFFIILFIIVMVVITQDVAQTYGVVGAFQFVACVVALPVIAAVVVYGVAPMLD